MSSRNARTTRIALAMLGVALIVSTVIWVWSLTGWLFLPALGLAILVLAYRGRPPGQRFVI